MIIKALLLKFGILKAYKVHITPGLSICYDKTRWWFQSEYTDWTVVEYGKCDCFDWSKYRKYVTDWSKAAC